MTIAELAVNIAVTGGQKANQALGDVRKGLSGISSMSLEAKAGIIGVLYALERLMSNSAQTGQGLMNFAAASGLSIKNLQQLQYAAQQAGISVQETESSITGLQSAMGKMQMGQGAPSGLAFVVNQTKMLTDPAHLKDTFYVFDKVIQYLKTSKDAIDVQNEVAKSFGFSANMVAAARRGLLDQQVRNKAPLYSNDEAAQLDQVARGWTNFGKQWEMIIGKLNASHGLSLVNDLSQVSVQVGRLLEQFAKLADNLKVFVVIGKVFEGWKMIFEEINGLVGDFNKGMKNSQTGKKPSGMLEDLGQAGGAFMNFLSGKMPESQAGAIGAGAGGIFGKVQPSMTTSMNVNVQNYGVEGADEIGEHLDRSVNFALRQMQSVNQVA